MGMSTDVSLLFFVAVFGLIHVAVLHLVVRMKMKKMAVYQNPFYSFFICLGVVDLVHVLNTLVMSNFPFEELHLHASGKRLTAVLSFVSTYSTHCQVIGNTVIAVNRWHYLTTAAKSASKRWTLTVTLFGNLFIFLLALVTSLQFDPSPWMDVCHGEGSSQSKCVYIIDLCVYFSGFVISLVFILLAAHHVKQQRKLTKTTSFRIRHETKLLLSSIFMLILLGIKSLFEAYVVATEFTDEASPVEYRCAIRQILGICYSLLGSTVLYVLSPHIRQDFAEFYHLSKIFLLERPPAVSISSSG